MAKYDENLTWIETVTIFYSTGKVVPYPPVETGLALGEYGLTVFDGIGKTFESNHLDHDYILNNYYGAHLFMCGGSDNWNSL